MLCLQRALRRRFGQQQKERDPHLPGHDRRRRSEARQWRPAPLQKMPACSISMEQPHEVSRGMSSRNGPGETFEAACRNGPPRDPKAACPICGETTKIYRYLARSVFKCSTCEHQYTATSGTRFHSRKLPLSVLQEIERLFKNGMNARQISAVLGINYRTAWLRTRNLRD